MRLVTTFQFSGSETTTGVLKAASGLVDIGSSGTLTQGTGAFGATKVHVATFSIAASGTASYDLSGSMVDVLGNAFVLTKLKLALIYHLKTSASSGILAFDTVTNYVIQRADTLAAGGVSLFYNPSA